VDTDALPDEGEALALPGFLRAQARAHGERELLVAGARRLTYRQVERESARLARGLLAAGVGKGSRVALLMPNGPDWVIAWLAAGRIGALVIPLSTFYQARELGWVLRHADVHTLLTCDRYLGHDYLERLEQVAPSLRAQRDRRPLRLPELPYLRAVRVWGAGRRPWADEGGAALVDAEPALDEEFLRAVEDSVLPADLAVLLYTSGSTAEPKGVCHTHGTLVRHSRLVTRFLGGAPDDRMLSPAPFFWVGGFHRLLHVLHIGGAMLFLDAFDAGAALELIRRERATILVLWPHQAKALLEHPGLRPDDLRGLRSAPWRLLPAARRAPAPDLVPNSIGMTETFAYHTIDPAGTVLRDAKRGACGHALPGMERRIADPHSGAPLPPGAEGELQVRGFNLMQGLYKREREQVFERDGFYRTGDRGRIDADGCYFFSGRLGDMIKTGGANVSPREVEAALLSLPGVAEACVAGVPDAELGELVAAAVVAERGARLDPEALRAQLRGQLSAFKVPRHLFAFEPDELPRTDAGKVHPARLRERLIERVAVRHA
jgi:acyl-CoA synthetase (AMP-forming)/AMP-acid ligase II